VHFAFLTIRLQNNMMNFITSLRHLTGQMAVAYQKSAPSPATSRETQSAQSSNSEVDFLILPFDVSTCGRL
jgi:hypothetical protein